MFYSPTVAAVAKQSHMNHDWFCYIQVITPHRGEEPDWSSDDLQLQLTCVILVEKLCWKNQSSRTITCWKMLLFRSWKVSDWFIVILVSKPMAGYLNIWICTVGIIIFPSCAINSDGSNLSWILHAVQILKNVKCLKHSGVLLVCWIAQPVELWVSDSLHVIICVVDASTFLL